MSFFLVNKFIISKERRGGGGANPTLYLFNTFAKTIIPNN